MKRNESPRPEDSRQPLGEPGTAVDHAGALQDIARQIDRLQERQAGSSAEIREMRAQLARLTRQVTTNLSAWDRIQLSRRPDRPRVPDYVERCVRDFYELHGDRCFRDDPAVLTGFGRIAGHRVLVVGHNKGRHTAERVSCCFGHAHPEGYRKALRTMKLAEKYDLPVVSLIDTPGAHPGIGAEERGIASAIASNLKEMSRLGVPIVCVVVGEGGSGGALGIGVADRVAMLEHAYYSVITPEGCAAILFDDADQAEPAAEALRLTAADLRRLGLIDDIIAEPVGGAHRDVAQAACNLERYLGTMLTELRGVPRPTLLARRHDRLRRAGNFVAPLRQGQGSQP